MRGFFMILVGLMMLATLGVLLAGMIGMVRETDPRRSNKLMQYRVIFQAGALVLLVIMMLLLRG
jgi:hypothetical protein